MIGVCEHELRYSLGGLNLMEVTSECKIWNPIEILVVGGGRTTSCD